MLPLRGLIRTIPFVSPRPFETKVREIVQIHICLIGTDNAFVSECPKQVGDHVERNDPLISVESRKLVYDVCSNVSGKLIETHVHVGDQLRSGHAFSIERCPRDFE